MNASLDLTYEKDKTIVTLPHANSNPTSHTLDLSWPFPEHTPTEQKHWAAPSGSEFGGEPESTRTPLHLHGVRGAVCPETPNHGGRDVKNPSPQKKLPCGQLSLDGRGLACPTGSQQKAGHERDVGWAAASAGQTGAPGQGRKGIESEQLHPT